MPLCTDYFISCFCAHFFFNRLFMLWGGGSHCQKCNKCAGVALFKYSGPEGSKSLNISLLDRHGDGTWMFFIQNLQYTSRSGVQKKGWRGGVGWGGAALSWAPPGIHCPLHDTHVSVTAQHDLLLASVSHAAHNPKPLAHITRLSRTANPRSPSPFITCQHGTFTCWDTLSVDTWHVEPTLDFRRACGRKTCWRDTYKRSHAKVRNLYPCSCNSHYVHQPYSNAKSSTFGVGQKSALALGKHGMASIISIVSLSG